MKIYALTGGIGSGKSTIAKFFEADGIPVISADALTAEAGKDPEIQKRIFDRFKTNDRVELRKIIFADMQAKRDMEAIMHPAVQDMFFRKFNSLYDDGHDIVLYESALVFELAQRDTFEGVISVVCPADVRLQRILARDPLMSEEVGRNIMSCQVDDEHRMTHSEFILDSNRDLESVGEAVKDLIHRIRQTDSLPSPNTTG